MAHLSTFRSDVAARAPTRSAESAPRVAPPRLSQNGTCGPCIRLPDRFLRRPERTGLYQTSCGLFRRYLPLRSVLFSEKSGGERVEKQRLMRFARQHVKRPKYSHQLWRVLALDLESNMVAVALWETQRQNYFTGGWRDRHNCAGSHGFDGPSTSRQFLVE